MRRGRNQSEDSMYLIPATISGLLATGLLVMVRRGWISRGPLRALAEMTALLAAIIAAALIAGPYAE